MKAKHIVSMLLPVAILLGGCAMEPRVLEFDDTYTPKAPTPGKRDPLPKIDVYHTYLYTPSDRAEIPVEVAYDDQRAVKEISPIPEQSLKLKTSIPASADLNVEISLMTAENSPKDYPSTVKGTTMILPLACYSMSAKEVTISKGAKDAPEVKISFNAEEFKKLDMTKDYIVPLVFSVKGDDKVIIHNNWILSFKVSEKKELPEGPNVRLLDLDKTLEGKVIQGNDLSFASNVRADRLNLLNDGQTGNSWYIQKGEGAVLKILFPKTKVKGFGLHIKDYKSMREMKVQASANHGAKWYSQGKLTAMPDRVDELHIAFIKPLEIDGIELSEFVPINSSGWMDIDEVYVIAEE